MEGFRHLLEIPVKHSGYYRKEHSKNVQGSTARDLVPGRFREGIVLDLFSSKFSNVECDEWIQLDLDVVPYAACVDSGE